MTYLAWGMQGLFQTFFKVVLNKRQFECRILEFSTHRAIETLKKLPSKYAYLAAQIFPLKCSK